MKSGDFKKPDMEICTLCKGIVGIKMCLEDNCQIFKNRRWIKHKNQYTTKL